jgi:D-glycero-D-manno-heptose 1,7-bisphosphate phosphatase
LFFAKGLEPDGVYYCPHGPTDGCTCRKPAPGMLLTAAAHLGIDLGRSWMIGDKASDLEAGRRAGCRGMLLRQGDEAQGWSEVVQRVTQKRGL